LGPFIDIVLLIGVDRLSKYYYTSPDELKELSEENKTINTLPHNFTTFKNSITNKIVFLLSILVSVFWLLPAKTGQLDHIWQDKLRLSY